ncbi:hypothetical protein [Hydrogenovibrio marinus]|nr:hypothetical protein [Hydrogenovibrio marinus]
MNITLHEMNSKEGYQPGKRYRLLLVLDILRRATTPQDTASIAFKTRQLCNNKK